MDNNNIRPNLIPRQRDEGNPILDALAVIAIILVFVSAGLALYLQFANRGLAFGSNVMITGLENENKALTEELSKIPVDEQKSADLELRTKIKRIMVFSELFKRHLKASNIFEFIKRSEMPEITITNFRADLFKPSIVIDGKSDSFFSVGRQFKVLQIDQDVESVSIESISLRGPDDVGFTFQIKPKLSAIKYNQ